MTVAKSLPHDAAALHVTGAARYIDDIKGTIISQTPSFATQQ